MGIGCWNRLGLRFLRNDMIRVMWMAKRMAWSGKGGTLVDRHCKTYLMTDNSWTPSHINAKDIVLTYLCLLNCALCTCFPTMTGYLLREVVLYQKV